jgi:hypothetical protein
MLVSFQPAQSPARAAGGIRGLWTAEQSSWRTKSPAAADLLQLTLQRTRTGGRDSSSFMLPLAELSGLARAQLSGATSDVRFTLARDAGTLSFEGQVGQGEGVGRFSFASSPEFAQALQRLGYGSLDDEKLYELALHDVSRAFIADLKSLGYDKVPLDDLVGMRIHGASPSFVRELAALGLARLSVDELVSLRIHGATPEFIRELKALGYESLAADDLVNLRIHGATPEFVRELTALGYARPSPDDLVSLRIHGVTPAFVRELQTLGYERVPLDDLVNLRIHGVTAEFIRRLQGEGRAVSISGAVDIKIHGRKR